MSGGVRGRRRKPPPTRSNWNNNRLLFYSIPGNAADGDWSGILLLLRYIFSSIISWVMIKKLPRKSVA